MTRLKTTTNTTRRRHNTTIRRFKWTETDSEWPKRLKTTRSLRIGSKHLQSDSLFFKVWIKNTHSMNQWGQRLRPGSLRILWDLFGIKVKTLKHQRMNRSESELVLLVLNPVTPLGSTHLSSAVPSNFSAGLYWFLVISSGLRWSGKPWFLVRC